MHWYSWLLLAFFIVCCLTLIGSVLLQSGKGDLASALGGGGAQNAFGPRGAASTLARATLIAAASFMVLSFLFSIPGFLSGGSVASDLDKLDKDKVAPKVSPTPLASPAPLTSPAPSATTGQTTPEPSASPASGKAEEKSSAKPEAKSEIKSDAKPAKEEPKADDKAKSATEAKKDAPKADGK